MNIFSYIKTYNYTFSVREFNEVDNLVFSALAYVNFCDIVPENNKDKITLSTASKMFFEKYDKKFYKYDLIAIKTGMKVLELAGNSTRYKDVLMHSYKYIGDESQQFSAVTFDYDKNNSYVSFEGTDKLVSGWEEDAKMAYEFPVSAHESAIKYLNKNFTFSLKNIIVGGHSKGGNLALVSSMYSNPFVRCNIKRIYSNDGQGLRIDEIESKKYEKIKSKYIHIIPYNSLVGLLLRHEPLDESVVIDAKGLMPLSHELSYWKINDDKFYRKNISNSSEKVDNIMINWLNKYDYETRKFFVKDVFDILRKNDIVDLSQIKQNYFSIFKLIKSSADLSEKSREMINDLFEVILEIYIPNKNEKKEQNND